MVLSQINANAIIKSTVRQRHIQFIDTQDRPFHRMNQQQSQQLGQEPDASAFSPDDDPPSNPGVEAATTTATAIKTTGATEDTDMPENGFSSSPSFDPNNHRDTAEPMQKHHNILLKGADDQEEDQDMQEVLPSSVTETRTTMEPPQTVPLVGLGRGLISPIITPSPFVHHNDSGTADRYRSALQRVNASPMSDVEAWEAIMNECMSLYRTQLLPQMENERNTHKIMLQSAAAAVTSSASNLNHIHNSTGAVAGIGSGIVLRVQRELDLEKKLDWVESCHGHLLKYFPYSSHYYVTAVEMLMARSALPFESLMGGGEDDYSYGSVENWIQGQTPWQKAASDKMDSIFEFALGVSMDGSNGVGIDSDGKDGATGVRTGIDNEVTVGSDGMDDGATSTKMHRDEVLLGMCSSSVELWLLYIRKRTRDAKRKALQYHAKTVLDAMNPTKSIMKLSSEGENLIRDAVIAAFETALSKGAAFAVNNHLIWKQYLNYVKSWNIMQQVDASSSAQGGVAPAVGGVNHALHSKQKELLRSIYQRIVALPMLGLDGLWKEYEIFEKAQSEQLAAALIEEYMPKYQHARSVYLERNRVYNIHELRMGRLATPPVDYDFVELDGTIKGNIDEEEYKDKMRDEIDLLTKWKRRSAYERTNPERLSASDLTTRIRQYYKDTVCCFMRHIEIWHEWSMWELMNVQGGSANIGSVPVGVTSSGIRRKHNVDLAIEVLRLGQKHIPDSGLLAYANAKICEEYVDPESHNKTSAVPRADEAIRVMKDYCSRASNTLGYVLLQGLVRQYQGINEARAIFSEARRNLSPRSGDSLDIGDAIGSVTDSKIPDGNHLDGGKKIEQTIRHETSGKIVMNRYTFLESNAGNLPKIVENPTSLNASRVTWHLYAAHATIEHRVNKCPKVAARVYELGLKKHRSFLSTPQYVLQYSNLLLELNDEENLRALLTRAISACEEENEHEGEDSIQTDSKKAAARREQQRPLWDMMLKLETILAARSSDFTQVKAIEARRRKALYGPSFENVAGGGLGDDVNIGAQKTSLSETLIRSDGYETCSRIVNGLSRLVDGLEISGVLGQDSFITAMAAFSSFTPGSIWKDDGCSGQSDASYRRRKIYEQEIISFEKVSWTSQSIIPGIAGASVSSGRLSSAKERLAQTAALNPNASVMAAVQASPEWLRGMLMLLPATIRNYRGKAPPHLIEMALSALRENELPSDRKSVV